MYMELLCCHHCWFCMTEKAESWTVSGPRISQQQHPPHIKWAPCTEPVFRTGCSSHTTASVVVGGMCLWLISVFQVQASLLGGDTRHHHIQPHHARSNKSGQYLCHLSDEEYHVIVGARPCCRYQRLAGAGGMRRFWIHARLFIIHLEWEALWLGTCLHLSPVAAHRSVRQQSIAIWFEPLRRGKGHAKNSTAKCFRETTNPEIQLSSFGFYFLSQYKLKVTIRKKIF